jgi:hypothetical protein
MKSAGGHENLSIPFPHERPPHGLRFAHGVVGILGADGQDGVPRHPQNFKDSNAVLIPRTACFEALGLEIPEHLCFAVSIDDDFGCITL